MTGLPVLTQDFDFGIFLGQDFLVNSGTAFRVS